MSRPILELSLDRDQEKFIGIVIVGLTKIRYHFLINKGKLMKVLGIVLSLVFSVSVSAGSVEEYFNILSKTKVDFDPDGAVCEQVALLEIEPTYPKSQFSIVNSIEYNEFKTTIGELDLVVFSKDTGQVKAIAEVKCWKSFKGGLKKAKEQRIRFQKHLSRNIVLTGKDGKKYSKEAFKQVERFLTISQEGGISEGFDFELSLNLKELIELRSKLLDCRAQGKCTAVID